jgi:alpha-L-fucosidase
MVWPRQTFNNYVFFNYFIYNNQLNSMKINFFFLLVVLINMSCARETAFSPVKPTAEQLAFQDMELGFFVHYSIDAYAERGSRPGQTPASAFNPTDLDVEQWVLAAKDMGAKFMVLTARHEQGFCLWPTKTTDYSIKNSPYKDGNGDIVREFVDACRKHGIKPGLYTAPWIDSNWESRQPGYKDGDSGDIYKFDEQELYDRVWAKEKEQITELMTLYGDLVFIWDDHFGRSDALADEALGGRLRELYADFNKVAHELQPKCLILGRDVEHVGTEDGRASYPLWNSLNTIDSTLYTVSDTYKWDHDNTGNPRGKFYRPQLSCTTVGFTTGGWMWRGYRTPQPMERVMKSYYETIGRGASLIINFAPDRRGLVEEQVVEAAKAFGAEIKRRFGNPVASSDLKDTKQIIRFDHPETFNHVVTMEKLEDGQRISAYIIEAEIDGRWKTIVNDSTIGHKRIDRFPPVTATALRFTVTDVVAKPVVMRNLSVFNVEVDESYK